MPVNVTEELLMVKAAPRVVGCSQRLQSKRVDDGAPLIMRDATL
jgi:hypothetical protein